MELQLGLTSIPLDARFKKQFKINLAAHALEDQEIMIGTTLSCLKDGRLKMTRSQLLKENFKIKRSMEPKLKLLIKKQNRVLKNLYSLALIKEKLIKLLITILILIVKHQFSHSNLSKYQQLLAIINLLKIQLLMIKLKNSLKESMELVEVVG